MIAARLLSRAGRGAARFGRAGYRAAARVAGKAYRVGKKNPFTAGMLTQSAISKLTGSKKKKRKAVNAIRRAGPVKRPKSTFRPTSGFHVADVGTPFKRGKKPNMSTKFTKRHYDDYGTISRNHSLWMGFQTHGCRERIMQMASEALLRALLSRVDYYPSTYDQVFPNNGTLQKLQLTWAYVGVGDGVESKVVRTYVLGGTSFESVAAAIRADFMATDATVQHGAPVRAEFFRNDSTGTAQLDRVIRSIEDVDKMKLKLYASQKIRVQNLSPNDAGTDTLDVNGTNPVQGKLYEFTTPPRLREQVRTQYPSIVALGDHLSDTGVLNLPDGAETGVDGVLGHPPTGAGLFTNVRNVANITIAAGGQKYKNTLFKFEGTVLKFCQMFSHAIGGSVQTTSYKKYGGGVIWIGLEQAFRQGSDTVKVGFNRELAMYGRAEFARTRPMLRHYEQTDLGDTI